MASFRLTGLPVLAAVLLTPPLALACRYNVRDLGFIEVPSESYALVQVAGSAIAPEDLATRQSQLDRWLRDTNLRGESLGTNAVASHPRADLLRSLVEATGPGGWFLLSADGFGTNLSAFAAPLPSPAEWPDLAALLGSPLTRQLAEACARSFGAILLIEGSDEARNATAKSAIQAAIREITEGMADLPKAVVAPPEQVVLPRSRIAEEGVVFWSLGLPAEVAEAPRAAVFYGTARWIGPLMEGTHISAENLTRLFWIIGADCECGMDLGWTRGTPLPLRWTEELHATAAKSLGFDPASPMVRAEALRIIHRYSRGELGDTYAARAQASSTAPPSPISAAAAPSPVTEGTATSNSVPPAKPPQAKPATEPFAEAPADSPAHRLLLIAALIGLVLLLGAMLVLLIMFHRVGQRAQRAARRQGAKR